MNFNFFSKKEKPQDYNLKELNVKLSEELGNEESKRLTLEQEKLRLEMELKSLKDFYNVNDQHPLVQLWIANGVPLNHALKCFELLNKSLQQQAPEKFSRTVVND